MQNAFGIDPTCRHGSDLGFVPILVEDACGAGEPAAPERALANLRFLGDTCHYGSSNHV